MSMSVHNRWMTTAMSTTPEALTACCTPTGEPAMSEETASSLAAQFKAIADPNRLRMVSIISSSENAEACVCDITEPLNLGQSTVSHHLKILVDAGVLTREKRGVWAYYSLVPGALDSLAGALTGRP